MNRIILNIVFLFSILTVFAQDMDKQLADYYFNQGDCEKAIPYFEKVYFKTPNDIIFRNYLSCLRSTNDDKGALKLVANQALFYPDVMIYQVGVGEEHERQGDTKRAENIYSLLIEHLEPNPRTIVDLQKAFSAIGKYQWALQTLKKGDQLLKGNYPLNIQFAEVYGELNDTQKMIAAYIDLLDYNPGMISSLKIVIPRMIDFSQEDNERFTMFQNELIRKIQKNPKEQVYSELLIWALVQRRNFYAALIQAKGLDKRTSNDGMVVYSLGNQALQNNDFSTAKEAFKYIVDLGEDYPYFFSAQTLLLNTSYMEITTLRNYTQEQVDVTVLEYKKAIAKMPKNGRRVPVMRELAYIQAYYGNQPKQAIATLDSALSLPRYNDLEIAKVKILQADVNVLLNNIWDASLLYMQVEKQFKFESIGEEAKFKNARIFYYDGDFKYAQSQLDILKEATTRLIANDAMNLSVFITDNLGLDSNYIAMRQFAKADLLLEQHRYTEAFQLYDSITAVYPNHKLDDDILMRKAKAFQEQGKWDRSIDYLQKIVDKFGEGILADDALYQIGQIYDNHLFDHEKASKCYFQLMKDYPGSVFVTDARKAYRKIN